MCKSVVVIDNSLDTHRMCSRPRPVHTLRLYDVAELSRVYMARLPRNSLEPSRRPFCMPSPYLTDPFERNALQMAVGGTRSRTHKSSMLRPLISALKPASRTCPERTRAKRASGGGA